MNEELDDLGPQASLAELADSVRDTYSRTGQLDEKAIERIVGSTTTPVEFSATESSDLLRATMANLTNSSRPKL